MKKTNSKRSNDKEGSPQISKETVIERIEEVYRRCMQAEPVLVYDKELKCKVNSGEWEFDASNALKALKMLGDAVGLFKQENGTDIGCAMSYEEFLKTGSVSFDF